MKFHVAILIYLLSSCFAIQEIPIHIPFYRLYHNAIDSYGKENWLEAINYFEWSLHQKELLTNSTISCLSECKTAGVQCSVDLCQMSDHKDIYYLVRHFHCMTNCKGKKLRSIDYMKAKDYNKPPDEKELIPFVSGILYDYLQYSYYKAGNIENSTRALRTWLAFNPDNPRAKTGLNYLLSLLKEGEVSEPRESPRFLSLFNHGWKAYSNNNWVDSVDFWESSIDILLAEIGKCRNTCDDSVPPIFSSLLFSQQYYTLKLHTQLKCHSNCYLNTTEIGGHENILFTIFLYLQYSYYKLQEPLEALAATKTAYLINPTNNEVNSYLKLYSELIGEGSTSIEPRFEVEKLLNELHQIIFLTIRTNNILPSTSPTENPQLSELELTQDSQNYVAGSRSTKPQILVPPTNFSSARVLVDNFLSEAECKQLELLADLVSVSGDGYSSAKYGIGSSPHTPHENFVGVTLERALQAWESGAITKKLVSLYLDAAERNRVYLETYFKLKSTLYFAYTHLVCRTAKENSDQESRSDLSHPVHADNCILEPDGTCLKVAPAYTWRDYSSLVYLTQDFEGGDFFFANRSTLQPDIRIGTKHCGRMVGFSAGEENLHGVLPVTQGKRCALALWFTLDRAHNEDRETIMDRLS
ncbi:Prolyl 3-hydroxylase 1-like [Oopsacas minuta]|uniref:procollagen-proline 3-dioxygenase n=1 Tax=Oopsacas minuta TaxID=111878 RepID=A0AAV7K5F1_9METZ|nr:Prolyl 3-hydroxylase 1-like [Oopsacas minuta]